jgi:prepilin-type N-terminal cleavage/methylation domain-containing protein
MLAPQQSSQRIRLPGFTLLELMISTVLGSILLLTASALFMTFMIGNANTNARRQMSAEGTQMLGTLEFHIRNAKTADCSVSNTLKLTKLDGTFAQACVSGAPLALNFSSTTATCGTPLNSNFVILAGTNPFTCASTGNGKTTVLIKFTLSTSEGGGITETFSRIVQLRNS